MGYAARSRLARYSGDPLSGIEAEARAERERIRPKLIEYVCPRCGQKALAVPRYAVAVCEPPITEEADLRRALAAGADPAELKRRKGCGWLLKLEPLAGVISVDDVAHVGPWRPTRSEVVGALVMKVVENWQRRGIAKVVHDPRRGRYGILTPSGGSVVEE